MLGFPFTLQAATESLAEWTFPESNDDNLVDSASAENTTELITAVGTTNPTFNAPGATTSAARATGWQNGAEEKYWTTKVNTTGYKDIAVSVKLRSSATGPQNFSLQYRIEPNSAWRDVVGGSIVVADNFTTGNLEQLRLPEGVAEQEAVFLRFVMSNNLSVAGGSVGSTGVSRLDDFIITGTPVVDPDESITPGNQCTGSTDAIRVNEILPYPNASDQEYVELFNTSDQCVNLGGWRLEDGGGHKYIFPVGTTIESEEYKTLVQNFYLNNTTTDTLTLYTSENVRVSEVTYEKALKGFSYSFKEGDWQFTATLTPGAENTFDETEQEEEIFESGSGIILNEIFPNPKTDEPANEFIELHNTESVEKNLAGWSLTDASHKIFTFEVETKISPNGFLVIPRSTFGFSLNNSGKEQVTLLDPNGDIVSEVSYTTTQEDASYSFTGSEWRWTKKITPGKKNEFSKLPKITLTSSLEGFVGIPLVFSATTKNTKGTVRYSWDFGDDHRSSLKEPKHTFEKSGTYEAKLTMRTKEDLAEKNFTVTIKKYPKYPVVIHSLLPNPKGKDTGQEWITLKNLSPKKINLTGWKIATGTENPVNHPLVPNITILPQETFRLTRTHAAFSLSNSEGVVELRYPNNEVASRTSYQEEEIAEDSMCVNQRDQCDFPDDLKKEAAPERTASQKDTPEVSITPYTEGADNPSPLETKEEILKRMGDDFNLLMNRILHESHS